MAEAALSAVIPTFRREAQLAETLERVMACDPAPAEILVHVDAGDAGTGAMLAARFPGVRLFQAETPQGPGGGRNRLMQEVRHEIVVSLDDDSYPIDADFFARVPELFDAHPQAGVLAMEIVHDGEDIPPRRDRVADVADFVGCGCAYRRDAFVATSGYLPLRYAYGMEEADLALQLIDQGWRIVMCHDLRIRHATDRSHQTSTRIVAEHIKNTMLLAFLRYRWSLFGLASAQYLNRIVYSLRRGHVRGAAIGLLETPSHLWRHRAGRAPVTERAVQTSRHLKRSGAIAAAQEIQDVVS